MPRERLRTEAFQGIGAALGVRPGRGIETLQTDEGFGVLPLDSYVHREVSELRLFTNEDGHVGAGTIASSRTFWDITSDPDWTAIDQAGASTPVPVRHDAVITKIGVTASVTNNFVSAQTALQSAIVSTSPRIMLAQFDDILSADAFNSQGPQYSNVWIPIRYPRWDIRIVTVAQTGAVNIFTNFEVLSAPPGVLPIR